MIGQLHARAIAVILDQHMTFRCQAMYTTRGGQAVQLHPTRVNCFPKPLLVYHNGDFSEEPWIGDLFESPANDQNDKRFHHWGQSETGCLKIVEAFTKTNDLILDPFLGGGSFGAAAMVAGRRFIGIDVDSKCIEKSRERLEKLCQK